MTGQALARTAGPGYKRVMPKRFAALVCLVLLGLALGGCTRCGWVWDDGPRACRADRVN